MGLGVELKGYTNKLKKKIVSTATEAAVKKFQIPRGAVRNMRSLSSLKGPGTGGIPTELLPLGAAMWSGYAITPFAQQQMGGWVLPYWLRQETTPSSKSFVPHSHVFLRGNMTHRNWTGVGLSGFPLEGSVDQRGLITPWPFSPSVDLWVFSGGKLACPSEMESVEQRLVDDLPLVSTTFNAFSLSCDWTTFVAPLDGMPVILSMADLKNPTSEAVQADIVVSVRPYNTESICAVNKITYDSYKHLFIVDDDPLVYLPVEPDRIMLSDYIHGDVEQLILDNARETLPAGSRTVEEPVGLATGAAIYHLDINAGDSATVCFACPLSAGTHHDFSRLLESKNSRETVRAKFGEQRKSWSEVVSSGMRLTVPDDAYQKAFDVNKTFLLLMYDGQSITPGVFTYHMMWFRDAAYLVPALERMGHTDEARRILLTYPDRQTPDGFFRSHSGEWDSNGQAMWTLVNHYRMTGDKDFLKTVYPSIVRGARWIDSMRQNDIPPGDPRFGLLPPGISAEHFGIGDTYYWDDIWAVGGLRAAAGAADEIGFKHDAEYMNRVANDLWQDLQSSWESVRKRLGREVMPISPARDVDAASIGTMAAIYPLDLIDPEEDIMANTVKEIVDKCFYRDTHYHSIMHCGINPYLSMHVAQYYLRLRNPYAHTIFESLWSMATDTYTYPEAINPLTGGGAYGEGHDGWCAGDIFNFVRNLFVLEERDRLSLLAMGKKEWFRDGDVIKVESAPSYFGEVTYSAISSPDKVEFTLQGEYERPPSVVELGVPFPIISCKADGKKIKVKQGSRNVEVPPAAKSVILEIKREGK